MRRLFFMKGNRMPIPNTNQPEMLPVDDSLRLRKFDGCFAFALAWYQDEDLVYLVDGVRRSYTRETLGNMYRYLDKQGELYFIETLREGTWKPIGDVTFWRDDMPIVIGESSYRGKGIGRKVVSALIQRGRELGYDRLFVNEIYEYNVGSRKCFENAGFRVLKKTEKGNRFYIDL